MPRFPLTTSRLGINEFNPRAAEPPDIRGEGKARGSILPAGQFDSAAPHQRSGMIRRKARLRLPARHRTPRRCLKRRETPSGGRLRADTGNRRRLSPRPHHRPPRHASRASVSLYAGGSDLLSQGSGAEDLPGCGTFTVFIRRSRAPGWRPDIASAGTCRGSRQVPVPEKSHREVSKDERRIHDADRHDGGCA